MKVSPIKFFIIYLIAGFLSVATLAGVNVSLIDVPPYGMKNPSLRGIHVDFISKVLEEAGLEFKMNALPYPRVLERMQKGKSDLILIFKRADLSNALELGESIGFENLIVSRQDSPIKNILELKNKKIGVIRDAKYEDRFDSDTSIVKVPLHNYHQALMMLHHQRVDGVAISGPAYKYILAHSDGRFNNFATPIVLNVKHNYFYANRSLGKDVIDKIKKANEKLRGQFSEGILVGPYIE